MTTTLSSFCTRALIMAVAFLSIPKGTFGQCPQPFEGTYATTLGGTGTPVRVSPYFTFLMPYSNCHVHYLIGEFRKNQQNLMLPHWCDEKISNHQSTSQHADSSSTQSFIVRTGDTLSFYRELSWVNPTNQYRLPNGYAADDNLDYSVEVISHATGQRLALIDSLGVL